MTDMTMGAILLAREAEQSANVSSLVAEAARATGASPFKMMREIMMLKGAPSHMTEREYFDFQLYDPSLSKDEKRAFIGVAGSCRLNLKLSPPNLTDLRGLLRDKVALTALASQLGLPTTETQALFTLDRRMGNLPCLRNVDEVEQFLKHEARYPLFGKPVRGCQAMGTVGIDSLDAGGAELCLAGGATVPARALAEEIVTNYPEGYTFQSWVVQHPEIIRYTGKSVGTVRLVTVVEEDTPRVLYALWKIPSATATSDNFWQTGNMLCRVDHRTGEVEACRTGKGLQTRWIEAHPDTGLPIKGFRIPNWDAIAGLALDAHAIFPVNGLLGWDIAVGPNGGVLVECNENPGHDFYQLSTGRGALSPELQATFDRVIARNKRLIKEQNTLIGEKY